jgi:hypothetical protein
LAQYSYGSRHLVNCGKVADSPGGWRGREIVDAGKVLQRVAVTQGVFYIASGVWPLIDIDSFQAVTGPKVDLWLVRTVGVLVSVIGAVLLTAAHRKRIGPDVTLLAIGSALGLAAIDTVYALLGVISPVYLADAVVELALVAGWLFGRRRAAP